MTEPLALVPRADEAPPVVAPEPTKTPEQARAEQKATIEAMQIKAAKECAPKIDALLKHYGLRLTVPTPQITIGRDGSLRIQPPVVDLTPDPAAW